jgi:rhodanese-related sulfurtransferase
MKNILLIGAFSLCGFAGLGGCAKSTDAPSAAASKTAEASLAMTSVDEVDHAIATGACTPVDANGDQTRKKMGTLPGAVLLTDSDNYNPSELPTDKTKALVFYCGGTACMASHGAANRAIALGYSNVKVMPDGISGWVKAGKKVQQL